MQWLITGDTHGSIDKFKYMYLEYEDMSEVSIIILGDAGVNYYLDGRDRKLKNEMEKLGCWFYLVRGNHEQRPEIALGKNCEVLYDEEVEGDVYIDFNHPHIRYLIDGNEYNFGGHLTLVLGGAYSIDKHYRLSKGWSWFDTEQLTEAERNAITEKVRWNEYDLVLTHTCPISWEPVDLFIGGIDQSTVDKSMETWLDTLRHEIHWNVWLFGHFHDDRMVRPNVEMLFWTLRDIDSFFDYWNNNKMPKDYFALVRDPRYFEVDGEEIDEE